MGGLEGGREPELPEGGREGSNHDMLSDFMYNTIFRNKRNKTIYVCGDFNVDLLQYDKHRDTNNFIDQLYSLGLHPTDYTAH